VGQDEQKEWEISMYANPMLPIAAIEFLSGPLAGWKCLYQAYCSAVAPLVCQMHTPTLALRCFS
jgi:hypothetical protein